MEKNEDEKTLEKHQGKLKNPQKVVVCRGYLLRLVCLYLLS